MGFEPLGPDFGGPSSAIDPATPDRAPGKTPRTASLPVPHQPLVAHGTVCQREPDAEDCYLSEPQRQNGLATLKSYVHIAMENFRDAIQDKRIELLTEQPDGPSILVEFLFELATGPLISVATRTAMRHVGGAAQRLAAGDKLLMKQYRARLGSVRRTIETSMGFATKKVSGALLAALGERGNRGKAAFLKVLRQQIPALSVALAEQAPVRMNDLELETFIAGYADLEAHSVDAYAQVVDQWLAGYDRNRIEKLGVDIPRAGTRHGTDYEPAHVIVHELAWVKVSSGGRPRLAVLSGPRGATTFDRFIDRQFEDLALKTFIARSGRPPDIVDLDDADQRAGCLWADAAYIQGIFDCSL